MRKFFSFRSSASSSANSNPTPTVPPSSSKENIYWETPRQNGGKYPVGEKIQDGSQMLDDSAFKPVNRCSKCEVIPHLHHRRSLSFCSAIHSCTREGNLYYSSNLSRLLSTCGSSPCHVIECHAQRWVERH